MAKVAFVFPGQGAQKIGMGKEAYDETPEARVVFTAADDALGESLSALCFEGPEAELKLTANTQPAILTASIALYRAFGEAPDVAAGHSLGEYSAHVCAGTMRFEDAVQTVRRRGRYMQEAVPVDAGAMAAVMGMERGEVDRICQEAEGVVDAVNYNSPQQTVIAGSAEGVKAAIAAVKNAGGKAVPLPVSAPFHSRLMKPAEDRLAPHLAEVQFEDPQLPVYVNVDAVPVAGAAEARDALVRQVSRPVRWQESVECMISDGVRLFVEIGPGKVLQGLIGRIAKDVPRVGVSSPSDFAAARAAMAEVRAEAVG